MKFFRCTAIFLISIFLSTGCSKVKEPEKLIKISAAASLTDVLNKIAIDFKSKTGYEIELNFASSSICARQIKEGKDCSIFISANRKWMEYLEGDFIEGTNRVLLNNSLVIVKTSGSDSIFSSLEGLKKNELTRIAIGDPTHVPAGIYARDCLERNGIWKSIRGRVVGAIDVRAALSLVETGAVDCGVVYKTDAVASTKVEIEYEIPPGISPEIEYMVCRIETNDGAREFYDHLFSENSMDIFRKYGFLVRGTE